MLAKEELLLIVYFIVVILLLSSFAIVFFITYQKRKNKILLDKFQSEQNLKAEFAKAKEEIQEQTLKNVSWELHDNIGQLLSVASIQLNVLASAVEAEKKDQVREVKKIVGDSLAEVRALSKSLNNEVVDYNGLEKSIQNELDRLNRLQILQAKFLVTGNSKSIPKEDSIILFRIIQEFLSNVIKHAQATNLQISLIFTERFLDIKIMDDGKGFDIQSKKIGSGLINMKSRAKLIQANFKLDSAAGKGTSLSLQYPLTKTLYEQHDSYR